jgi:hypothetical protein
MRRAELLIDEIRAMTGNARADDDSGVSQKQMVRVLKNAQDSLFKNISNAKTRFLLKEVLVDAVNNQDLYSYPFDLYLQNIESMQWSLHPGQNGIDYVNMTAGITKDRQSSENGYAFSYILRHNGYILSPPISNGKLRVTYQRRLPEIEKRSGQISSVTFASLNLSAMTLDPSESSFDRDYLNSVQTMSVVGKYGDIKARNIEITSVASNGVVTLAAQDLPEGSTIAVGDYVTAGRYSVNASELPDICESHMLKHAIYETRYGDYSNWTKAAIDDLNMSLQTILDSFAIPTADVCDVPITSTDYLSIF